MEEYGTKVAIGKILNKPLRIAARIANVDFVRHIGSYGDTSLYRINGSILFSTFGKGGTVWISDGEMTVQDIELVEECILGNVGKDYLEDIGIDTLDALDIEFLLGAVLGRLGGKR